MVRIPIALLRVRRSVAFRSLYHGNLERLTNRPNGPGERSPGLRPQADVRPAWAQNRRWKSSGGPDEGNPPPRGQGLLREEGLVEVLGAGPNRACAKRWVGVQLVGKPASDGEARYSSEVVRTGAGVGSKFCVLPGE